MTAVLLLLLAAPAPVEAPLLPSVVTLRPKERRVFRPPCVVEALAGTALPKGVSVEIGEELLRVGADFNVATQVELACRFAVATKDADGKLQCPEGSERSAAENAAGATVVQCLGGRTERFRLNVREDAPVEVLPKQVTHFAGEVASYKAPCRLTPRPFSEANAWLEVSDADAPRVIANRAGETTQTYFCEGEQDGELRIKVLPFEARAAQAVTAFSKGAFGLLVGESRAFFAPCEFETFEKTAPMVALKKRTVRSWLVTASKPGVGQLHFGCRDSRRITVELEVRSARAANVKAPEKNLVILYTDEVRLFAEPCAIARLSLVRGAPELRPVGEGVVSLRSARAGKASVQVQCREKNPARVSWLVETVDW